MRALMITAGSVIFAAGVAAGGRLQAPAVAQAPAAVMEKMSESV